MRPKIEVQIRDVDQLITERPELREYLELHKLTLRARIEIEGLLGKGTDLDLGSPSLHRELQDKALKTGKPISHLISPSLFNHELLSSSLRRLLSDLRALSILEGEQIDKLIDLAQAGWNFSNVLMAVLRNDRSHLERLCSELKLDWKLLLFAFSILLQPLLEELARNLGGLIVERWWQADCPVCGRLPIIAKIKDDRKRYLVCSLCGAEYLADLFLCPHCNNRDPYKLKFISPESEPWFSIDFCEVCKHYLKVIDISKLPQRIPSGLEDVLTLSLDVLAEKQGLKRDF